MIVDDCRGSGGSGGVGVAVCAGMLRWKLLW